MDRRKKRIALFAAAGALLLAGCLFFGLTVNIEGRRCGIGVQTLTVEDAATLQTPAFSRLRRLTALRIEDAQLSDAAYRAVCAALPDCTVARMITLSCGAFMSDEKEMVLTAPTAADVALLDAFWALRAVTVTDCENYALLASLDPAVAAFTVTIGGQETDNHATELTVEAGETAESLLEKLPCLHALATLDLTKSGLSEADSAQIAAAFANVATLYPLRLGGTAYTSDATELYGMQTDGAELLEKLAYFPQLQTADLTACSLTLSELSAIREAYPALKLHMRVPLGDAVYDSEAETLDLSALDAQQDALLSALALFAALQEVTLSPALTPETVLALMEACPQITFEWQTVINDATVHTSDTELNLSKRRHPDLELLRRVMPCLGALTRVDLCDSGVTDAQMEALCTDYPEVRFVWTVWLGGMYSLRTDTVAFSTMKGGTNPYRMTSSQALALKYCTDLVALDLGHNDITDLSMIAGLKNLKILILADNEITDISPLAGLDELMYIEIFMNPLADFSPLAGKEKLLDLNVCYTTVTDPAPFYQMPALERLWASVTRMSEEDCALLAENLPNTEVNTEVSGSTNAGWREHERYFAMYGMFKSNTVDPLFK